jgi:hypothetical protein
MILSVTAIWYVLGLSRQFLSLLNRNIFLSIFHVIQKNSKNFLVSLVKYPDFSLQRNYFSIHQNSFGCVDMYLNVLIISHYTQIDDCVDMYLNVPALLIFSRLVASSCSHLAAISTPLISFSFVFSKAASWMLIPRTNVSKPLTQMPANQY